MLDLDLLSRIFSIIVIDLVLSGDNAVVIGLAARRLNPRDRRRAIILGGAGAVGLRVLFTAMAAILLDVPYLQAAGGLLLLYIAYKLVKPHDHGAHVSEAGSLREAIRTIVLADVVMSLDNILAVGGAAHGNLWLLLFGLVLSIPILLLGSELVARMLGRYPILVYVGVIVLVITAVGMVLEDRIVHDWREFSTVEMLLISAVAAAVTIALGQLTMRRQAARASAEYAAGAPSEPTVVRTTKTDGRAPERPAAAPADESAPTLSA